MNKVEPTEKQKKAVNNMIAQKAEGGNINKGKALLDAGYGRRVSMNPRLVTETVGFKQLMEEHLPDVDLVAYLAEDIKDKPGNRIQELKLAFGLKGHGSENVSVDVSNNREMDILRDILNGKETEAVEILEDTGNIEEQLKILKGDDNGNQQPEDRT
jgi:hypothetical protein